ncbi:MAG: Uma2 family endonuclease [Bacteroidota bacterium]|nr:Uma2 family endonuclease [Bacteroidota bacterium]
MSNTETLIRKLKAEPNVALIMQSVQKDLDAEKKKRQEFYDLIHEDIKAEFINGEIIMHSPTMRRHWKTSMKLSQLMANHVEKYQLGEVGVEKVMLQFTRNDYEPDIVFFSKEKSKDFYDEQLLFPAPDLVVEILSESTKKRDRGIKFVDYAAHGVYEYWIVDPSKKSIEQYVLRNGEYFILGNHQESKFRTDIIKGLEIDVKSLFE